MLTTALTMQDSACRDGSADAFLSYFAKSAPNLPENARQAVVQMVQSCPQFYPIPSWTHLSQLHGPRVSTSAHIMERVLLSPRMHS